MAPRRHRLFAGLLLLGGCLRPAPARAQGGARGGGESAQELFDRAKALHAEGRYEQACPLFARSEVLEPGIGTKLYLADCYEQIGRNASAWSNFLKAAASARARGQAERERVALARASALEPQLSKIGVVVASESAALAGLSVRRDGESLPASQWGAFVPVDPGLHTVEASAPGRRPFAQRVLVAAGAARVQVLVPLLAPASAPAPAPPAPAAGRGRVIAALALGSVGVAGLALGTFFGLRAFSLYDEAKASCERGEPDRCTPEGVDKQRDASRAALSSTVGFAAGGAALALGGALLLLGRPAAAPARAAWSLSGGPGGVTLKGSF
ncbi:MAG TPA: hypothetical protein VFS43_21590 [Polyangiaceae bacterium]|nr:hypothetical protein [Polyangiaceae bacterium]